MEFIENFISVNSLLQQCKRKNFLLYVHYRHCWWGKGNPAASLVETAVAHDSSAPVSSNESASRETAGTKELYPYSHLIHYSTSHWLNG